VLPEHGFVFTNNLLEQLSWNQVPSWEYSLGWIVPDCYHKYVQQVWWFFYMKVDIISIYHYFLPKIRYQSCWSQEHWHIFRNRTIIRTTKLVQWSSVLVKFYVLTWNIHENYHSFKLTTYACFEPKQPNSQKVCFFHISNTFSYVRNIFKDIYFFPSRFLTTKLYACPFFPCMLHAMFIACSFMCSS